MFYIRLIIFLFVAGSFNLIALLIAHTLPALHGFHQQALAVTAGFLLIADVILLYLLVFKFSLLKRADRYRKFEDILSETQSGDEPDSETFKKALEKWKDSR